MDNQDIKNLDKTLQDFMRKSEIADAKTQKDIEYIKKEIGEIKQLVSDHYVTKVEFDPIKKIVYGLVALVLTTVFVGILALVIK